MDIPTDEHSYYIIDDKEAKKQILVVLQDKSGLDALDISVELNISLGRTADLCKELIDEGKIGPLGE